MKNANLGNHLNNRQEFFMLVFTSLQAFFIGAFISLFNIGSHVLFLQSFEPGKIPHAYIISGLIGIGLFTLYSYLINRTNFRVFTFLCLFVLFIANMLLLNFYEAIAHFQLFGIALMLPFTLCIPFSFLVMVLFRRSVAMMLTPEQHRRFCSTIRTALIMGMVGASYALVGALYIHWDILLITAGSALFIGLASLMQLLMNYHHHSAGTFPQPAKHAVPLRSKFYEMFYTRYTLLLVTFVMVSALVGFIIHFQFVSGIRYNYPQTIGLAKFFGFFTGTMFLFIFGVERFLVRKILYSYDSPYSLVLVPAVLVIASVASLIIDLLVGQSNVIARFSFGFLMVAMLKIGYETTYEAIELPSLRVLFRTLDLRFLNSIKPRLEGSFRMAALLLSGITLSGFLFLNLGRSLFINLLIVFLTLVWLPLGLLLVKLYQNALRDYIRRLKATKRGVGQELLNTNEKYHSLINGNDPVKSINTLSLLERLEPLTHEKHLISLLGNESAVIKKYLFERIDENALLKALPRLKELKQVDDHKQQNGHLSKLISRFETKLKAGDSSQSIERIVNSTTLTDRILAAEIIGNSDNQDWGTHLLHLSRDFEPEVKLASVKAMARLANPNHSYVLIGYLTTPAYYPYAFEALVKIGDPALPFLEQVFLLPEADNTLLSRIVRIYGKIGSPEALEFLLGKIENQNRTITRQTLLALREAKFQSTPGNINRILNGIVRLINVMSWNFSAFASISNHKRFKMLAESLALEIQENYSTLYHLLALAYNPTSIGNIKNMLTTGSDSDISFAIELLDQIMNEEIKQVFFPVVENITVKERFKQLQYFFPAVKESPENLIQEIITRDFNQLSLYVKACAIKSIPNLKHSEAGPEIIASIFHPNRLIRETAAYVLEQIEPGKIETVYSRLGQDQVNELSALFGRESSGIPYLLLDRIRFIKNCRQMQNISEDVLLEISRTLDIQHLNAKDEFLIKREDVHFAFMIIIEGTAQINISSGKVFTFEKNDIIYSDIYAEDNTYSFRALTDLRFYSLEQEVLNSLMFDFIDFRDTIMEIIEEA